MIRVTSVPETLNAFRKGLLNEFLRAGYEIDGVHPSAAHKGKETFIPFDERMAVVGNTKYVDKVIPSEPEDYDIYRNGIIKYDYLFVGSDYKGTERFKRYEEFFADKGVKIVYFPYTKGTSSTQIRDIITQRT